MTGLTTVASSPDLKEKLRFASFVPHSPLEGIVSQDVSARGLQFYAEGLFLKLKRPFHCRSTEIHWGNTGKPGLTRGTV